MDATTVPRFAELAAPANWRTVDFISDLHLQASEPATYEVWQRYMAATPADAVFILGDLFEVWVGDDILALPGFEADCAAVMHATAQRTPVFFMHGNRDFLAGGGLIAAAGATLLHDPTVLGIQGQRFLLTHGDALCLDDHDYMAFRAQVRTPQWQERFVAQPLAQRQAVARGLRDASESRKRAASDYADVDAPAAREWLVGANATVMIHGHTHKPAAHDLGHGLQRVVLSDWDATAQPARLQVLRLDASGLHRLALA
jgi:UDP-2,3-diacylglucosamine hydrolase